jgi:hypothetical protein
MMRRCILIAALALLIAGGPLVWAQEEFSTNLYDVPPRWLIDVPTAGTFPRGYFNIGVRIYPNGGAIGNTDIGLSNRFTIGISYGGEDIISNTDPNWNPRIEFNVKFRFIDELEYFPAVTGGFSSQGFGAWNDEYNRYTFKSRGFYAVISRSFYLYEWTSGWHAGINYSLEDDDGEKDVNIFLGVDATFKYNLALLMEYDVGLNDDRSRLPDSDPNVFGGKGRGYLNVGIKWLFTRNLEMEAHLKDLLLNRRESDTITREITITYIDRF